MNYKEAVEYLYEATPQFQRIGAAAYKPGLDTVRTLAQLHGNPHDNFPVIHVAGTNGKGSVSHTLAAVLQSAGYRTGLYTSPHLLDFRERIKINGEMIPCSEVVKWLENYIEGRHGISPSFFELTTVMAFDYFAKMKVDVAVIEVGLGGRLDSTNIVNPVLSVITNISKDHTAQLGDRLASIAHEKAGIIKPGKPVVLGNSSIPEVTRVIEERAETLKSPLYKADKHKLWNEFDFPYSQKDKIAIKQTPFGDLNYGLTGLYQKENASTVLEALKILTQSGWKIGDKDVQNGFENVVGLTGLSGRWMVTAKKPFTICDTGHNEGGWRILSEQLKSMPRKKHIIIGFVNDKDVDSVLKLLPKEAYYYFTQASVPRALESVILKNKAQEYFLDGNEYSSVKAAYTAALKNARPDDMIFIGGSTFVVADFLALQRDDQKFS